MRVISNFPLCNHGSIRHYACGGGTSSTWIRDTEFQACACVSRSVTVTVSDPESHAHNTFVDFLAHTLDMTGAV